MIRAYVGVFVLAWLMLMAVFFGLAQSQVTTVVVPCGGGVSMLTIPQTAFASVDDGKGYIDAQIAQSAVVGWLIAGNV